VLQHQEQSIRKRYRKIHMRRKLDCTARIYVKEIMLHELAFTMHDDVPSAEYCVVEM